MREFHEQWARDNQAFIRKCEREDERAMRKNTTVGNMTTIVVMITETIITAVMRAVVQDMLAVATAAAFSLLYVL